MLRQPGSLYEVGRSSTLLKVKTFHDAEAIVIGHQGGAGKHKGRLGALAVKLADGTEFAVGTGFSDEQRDNPPPVGSTITFRYQELSDAGVPRFPSFVGVRVDAPDLPLPASGRRPAGRVCTARQQAESSPFRIRRRHIEQVLGSLSQRRRPDDTLGQNRQRRPIQDQDLRVTREGESGNGQADRGKDREGV